MATLHVTVGLPAAGKTTLARRLAAELPALRLTTDEWMVALFGVANPSDQRDVVEARLLTTALQALGLGVDVVLDFGLWGRDERWALHRIALDRGCGYAMHHLPVGREEQWERVSHRWGTTPHATFPMTRAELDAWREQFHEPDAAELAGEPPPPPPAPWATWEAWAVQRWPTLALGGRER